MKNVIDFPIVRTSGGRMTSGNAALNSIPKAELPPFVDRDRLAAVLALEEYEANEPTWRPAMYRNRRYGWFRQLVRWLTL